MQQLSYVVDFTAESPELPQKIVFSKSPPPIFMSKIKIFCRIKRRKKMMTTKRRRRRIREKGGNSRNWILNMKSGDVWIILKTWIVNILSPVFEL